MNYDAFQEIAIEVKDKIATITMDRPEVGNAFAAPDSYVEIRQAFEMMDEDEDIGVIIVTGKGRFFSAGGDILDFKDRIVTKKYITLEDVINAGQMGAAPKRCKKPVIAMMNGVAAGAGASLALACDFRFMTEKSKFVMAFVNMALPGDTGAAYYLQQMVGTGLMTQLMVTGEPLSAKKAEELHVATVAEDEAALVEATYAFARKLANGPLMAYKWQKELWLQLFYPDLEKATALEAIGMNLCSNSHDFEEAVNAFLEKRRPKFSGT